MAIRLASLCCDAVKRHAANVCRRDGLSPDYTYAVLNDDERHAAAIISLDRNSLIVRRGCAQATVRAILSAEETDAARIFWEPFGFGAHVQGDSVVFLMQSRAGAFIPRQPMPGLHVVSSPTKEAHLLIRASSDSDARLHIHTDPHIVAEVGVVYDRHRVVEPKAWHRCIVTASSTSIRFDPPFTHWSDGTGSSHYGFTDRTMRIRFNGVDGILRDIVPPGLVRICKMDCSNVSVECQPTRWVDNGRWSVEAVERIAPARGKGYVAERRAVELLSVQIKVVSARAARLIQRAWRRAVSDPAYDVCLRRLAREFDEGLPMM